MKATTKGGPAGLRCVEEGLSVGVGCEVTNNNADVKNDPWWRNLRIDLEIFCIAERYWRIGKKRFVAPRPDWQVVETANSEFEQYLIFSQIRRLHARG